MGLELLVACALISFVAVHSSGVNQHRQICFLPEDRGYCDTNQEKKSQIRWFYDSRSAKCRVFTFSGCRGNANNFWDERQCTHHCHGAVVERICTLTVDAGGPCQSMSTRTRYYYEPSADRCLPFLYAGCGGNQNHFVTADECHQYCNWKTFGERTTFHQDDRPAELRRDRCTLMADKGNCNGQHIQWYFDNYYSQCKPFIYGGCGGNANRFHDAQQCSETCGTGRLVVCIWTLLCTLIAHRIIS
uniref:BPTI/Kunitz inhibitor domain-containing protein n=1 Tax=Plectus sambesii TaxID=2011161 RepID=A0A914XKV6_9BILA